MRAARGCFALGLALGCAVLCLGGMTGAQAQTLAPGLQPVPKLEARVTDLTGTLTAGEQTQLEQKLADYEARKGAQIAVLLVATTKPEEIEQYSIRVVEAWKLGRKKTDDGALLLLAKDDRDLRIEVGYGLEGVLTDATSRRIIDETIVPLLQQGQYFAGISAGVDRIMRVIDGEPLPPPDRRWQRGGARIVNALPFLLVAFLVGSAALRALLGRTAGAAFSGVGAGLLVFLLSQVIGLAIGAAVVAFIVALLLGFSGGGWSSGGRGGFGGGLGGWGGGLGGGLGGSGLGGGFGGFGGGGGGFGGGGASGRW